MHSGKCLVNNLSSLPGYTNTLLKLFLCIEFPIMQTCIMYGYSYGLCSLILIEWIIYEI